MSASFDIFPPTAAQVGLAWGNKKRPEFSTLVQRAVSGSENRISQMSYPIWNWDYGYKKLEQTGDAADQLHAVLGFHLSMRGRKHSFLIKDTEDYQLNHQLLGYGNDAQKQFQLVRTYGTFVEPIFVIGNTVDIPGITNTLRVFLNDVEQFSGFTYLGEGILSFTTAPGLGVKVDVICDLYFRVRFVQDDMEVEQLVHNFWTAQNVELTSVRNTLEEEG